MSDHLSEICQAKRRHIALRKERLPQIRVETRASRASPPRSFLAALHRAYARDGFGLICEIKKASPSRGLIRPDFDPQTLARAYAQGGATCLSVLTDTPYFQGRDEDLPAVRGVVTLPVLRKDFLLDPYQVYESRALGADCVLLILAALTYAEAVQLEGLALELGMDVLLEVHSMQDLEKALMLRSALVGINNRNLKTLGVDLTTTLRLAASLPSERFLVSESGISTREDIDKLLAVGAKAFLIGETFMRQDDVTLAVTRLKWETASS